MKTFQDIITSLSHFWANQGCNILQGYDLEVGAGTFNPATFLRCLGPNPFNAAYLEPSRRPSDGRYGDNPNRLQHFFQYQVVMKPSPLNIQDLYLKSLEAIGFDLKKHDVRFVHDDWESPTLGAWGLGWEVWIDGMEISQFTYFQSVGGITVAPVTGEITYGLERLAMYLQKKENVYDLNWNETLTYGDIYLRNEVEWSTYNFENANTQMWLNHFNDYEKEALNLIEKKLIIPAYDFIMKASHAFNILDARAVISVSERWGYISKIRNLSIALAHAYTDSLPSVDFTSHDVTAPIKQKKISFNPHKKVDFVLEIGSEQLPHSFIPIGMKNLKKLFEELFKKHDILYSSIETYGSPRRLSILIKGLCEGSTPSMTEKKGPKIDKAFNDHGTITPAGKGFFKSCHLEECALNEIKEIEELSIKKIKDEDYLFFIKEKESVSTHEVLQLNLEKLIFSIDFPKKMRWSHFSIHYARPLRWILALFGSDVVQFNLSYIKSSNFSYGHQQRSDQKFNISKASNYIGCLKKHLVMVDPNERKEIITSSLRAIEERLKAKIVKENQVLEEVVNLTEWPEIVIAEFDTLFLQCPQEVLISEMIEHQKYFPLQRGGSLINKFLICLDNKETKQMVEGNIKALSPRLKDGLFLFNQDLKTPLSQFVEKLNSVTFHKSLGSLYEKTKRLVSFSKILSKHLAINDTKEIERAAFLSKGDLVSKLVFEFPELQGIIGRYYAIESKEEKTVAKAIEEHWLPRFEDDNLPSTLLSSIISLVDKIDNIIACFSIGKKPTSSSDPYALRRQTLGIIKIIIHHKISLPFFDMLGGFIEIYEKTYPNLNLDKTALIKEIKSFFSARITTVFTLFGLDKNETKSSLNISFTDIYDTYLRATALHEFKKKESFSLLIEVYKRAKGQIQHQEQTFLDPKLLKENAEVKLNAVLDESLPLFKESIENKNYEKAYQTIALIQPFLANLFDNVKILADDNKLKDNRIALLIKVMQFFENLVDFDQLI